MATGTGSNGRQGEATAGDGVAPKLHQAACFEVDRGLLGLAAASAAITLAVSEPPPWLDRNAYFVALSGAFFAGMAQVVAAFVSAAAGGRGHVAGKKELVMYASLVVVAGLTAASLLM